MLYSITADNAWASEFVTLVAPGAISVCLVKHLG
jgi:hypothetical protein